MLKKSLLLSAVGFTALGLSSAVFAASFDNSNQDVYVGIQAGYGDTHASDINLTSSATTLILLPNGDPAVDQISVNQSGKGTGFAGRAYAGFDFNQFLAVESGFTYFPKSKIKQNAQETVTDLMTNQTFVANGSGSVSYNTYGVDLLGKISVPVVDNFGLYAKAGPGYLHASSSGNSSTDNIDLVYGFGADYQITPHLVADASFLRYNGNHKVSSSKYQPNADLYSVGLAYKFNI